MIKAARISWLVGLFLISFITLAAGGKEAAISPYVDAKGDITLPKDFRATWVHLGTTFVTSQTTAGPGLGKAAPGSGFHDVYTKPEFVKAHKKTGKWPDGTIFVMETRDIKWSDVPTGHVVYGGDPTAWFVMVKDGNGRFKNNPNWGEGWGWALFRAADPKKNASEGYRNDCLSCHEVAKDTDWVFTELYPTLQ